MHFKQTPHLNEHVASIHKGKKKFQNDLCNKKFTRQDYFDRHTVSVPVHDGESILYSAHR